MNIYIVQNTFNQIASNPFNNNEPYLEDGTLVRVLNADKKRDFKFRTRPCAKGQVFQFEMTKELEDWKYRLCDFIQYESNNNKNIILAVNENDLSDAKAEYGNSTFTDPLRGYEPKLLVHTTIKEYYEKIMDSGLLMSWNMCKAENPDWEAEPIGKLSNDPADYSNYIMFGTGGVFQELIPLAKQRGHIDMNIDGEYTAGARFYFNLEAIAGGGLLVRDGIHLKVRDKLPLKPYLYWVATPREIGLPEQTTPRRFAETADRQFEMKYGITPVETSE